MFVSFLTVPALDSVNISKMRRIELVCPLVIAICFAGQIIAAPTDTLESLVVASTEKSSKESKDVLPETISNVPKIYKMFVKSDISNRFAHTTIVSNVGNLGSNAQEATFSVVLPEKAFISGFVMEIDGKNYTAYVKDKEEAKIVYDEAVASGLGAAHVAVSARDSNRFTVSVNVEPQSKAAFHLSYEELLQRQDGHYEQVINIHPGQPVKDLSVEVAISESRKIIDLKAPPLRSGNEIGNEKSELDPRADIELVNDTAAIVRFSPNLERQKQLAHLLGTKEEEGLAGQFVVQYDVERDPKGGEVLIQDGYFVHFFAPTELTPLVKHVVFVLDTSGSMYGDKIEQLKKAMHNILEQLHENDLFTLVEFNSYPKVHNLHDPEKSATYYNSQEKVEENNVAPQTYLANGDNIKKAQDAVSKFEADGGTNILDALNVTLNIVEQAKKENKDINRQPMIIFLTDGQGYNIDVIITEITEYNSGIRKSPIYSLSFGEDADKEFLKKLSLLNSGFSKHIYEASDASLQLQDFYKQISSPLLANVTFKYAPSATSLTKTEFPIHFLDSEIVVAGQCGSGDDIDPEITGWGRPGPIILRPTVTERSISSVERLWAYLTIKQLLDKKETSDKDKEELKKKALDLALEYSFVTPVSSLVVVKPNDTNAVDTEAADAASRTVPDLGSQGFPKRTGLKRKFITNSVRSSNDYEDTDFDFNVLEAATTSAGLPKVLGEIPWLEDVLEENGDLNLPIGKYKLGRNESIVDIVECPRTPLNQTGHCALLYSCPQVHSLLTSVEVYSQYFCVPKSGYAGVCCPNMY